MSSRPLVPSKDALRTLRAFAYSPPAALLGTVGAFCGIAAIHCHERQRVRRAQAILETKRKLHSISKGKGLARLTLMFEAAEKGEDFTIQRSRRHKPSDRRNHSVLTSQSQLDHNGNSKLYSAPRENIEEVAETPPQHNYTVDEGKRMFSARSSSNLLDDRSNKMAADDSEEWIVSRQTRVQSKLNKDTRPYKHTSWTSVMLESRRSILEMPQKIRDKLNQPNVRLALGKQTYKPLQWQPFNSSKPSMVEQPITDLNPPGKDALSTSGQPPLSPSVKNTDSIILQTGLSSAPAANSFGSLQPWQAETASATVDNDHREPDVSSSTVTYPDLYMHPLSPVPSYKKEHSFDSRYDFTNKQVKQSMEKVGAYRYSYVFTSIMNFRQRHGKSEALLLLEQTMERYTVTERPQDFALVQALFLDCTTLFSTDELKPLTWRFVDKFLQGDTPRLEVVSLLYPRCGAGTPSGEQHYYFPAHQYLESIREKGYSLDKQVTELRKILSGTHMCNLAPHEHLIVPALRSFCRAGQMSSAQALFDEMVSVHKIDTTFYTLQVLVKGYAKAGNWFRVKSMLDDCHYQDLSRRKVYGISGLLVSVISDYAVAQPPEKVVDFVMHALKEYGIQPISGMTREIVSLCLRERRYDLVVNWVNMVRTDYPYIEVGTGSATFAFDISCVWRDTDASCEDILAGCRAIASQAIRDPFSKAFRSVISDAVTRYMRPRLKKLRELLGVEVPDVPSGQIANFHTDLKRLKEFTSTEAKGSRTRLLLSHLLAQGEALRWINALCRGHTQSQGVVARSVRFDMNDRTSWNTKVDRLPPISALEDTLLQKYERRRKLGMDIEHETLRDNVSQLVLLGRAADAFRLIQMVYDSQWVQPPSGQEFDLDLFIDWLKLAWDLKSGNKMRSVLWAVLDAGPQLKLDSHIILLARIAAPKTHLQKVKRARVSDVDEVEYLRLRLRRRHWASSTSKRGLEFDEWHGFGAASDQDDDDAHDLYS